MAGIKFLADGNVAFIVLPSKPVNINAVTLTEALAGTNYSTSILASDFDLGATGSETVDEKSLAAKGKASVPGMSQYGGGMSVWRSYDPVTKLPDPDDDELFQIAGVKGTTLHAIVRDSAKDATDPITVGDEYSYFEVVTDDPKRVQGGNIKRRIELLVQNAALDKKIVAGA